MDTDPYIIVTGLVTDQWSYAVEISSVVNAPHSGTVSDVLCEFYTDNACTDLMETGDTTRITFVEDVMDEANVAISFDDTMNGAIETTMTVGMLLTYNIVAYGSITLDLPGQNYWNTELGAPNKECLVYDCEPVNTAVTVSM